MAIGTITTPTGKAFDALFPTASSGSVPAGSEGGSKSLFGSVLNQVGSATALASSPASKQTLGSYASTPITQGFAGQESTAKSLQAQTEGVARNQQSAGNAALMNDYYAKQAATTPATGTVAQPAGIPGASGTSLSATALPGAQKPVLTDAEKQLLDQKKASALQSMTLNQQGQQAALRQQAAQSGLSPEVAAGMQQLALAQGAQDVRSKIMDVTNDAYGHAVERMSAEETRRAQQQADAIDTMLTTNLNGSGWDAAIDTAIRLDPTNEWYKTLKANPSLLANLGNQNLVAQQATNRELSTQVLANADLAGKSEDDVAGTFGTWRSAEYTGTEKMLEAAAKTYNFGSATHAEDLSAYERAFGTKLDPNNEVDRETAAAWSAYRSAVKTQTAAQVATDLATELQNGGVALTEEDLARVEAISSQLVGMTMDAPVKMGGVSSAWDGDLKDGKFSIYFTDWLGNDLTGNLAAQANDPAQANLNAAWVEYVKGLGDQAPMSRDEFRDTLAAAGLPGTVKATPAEITKALTAADLVPKRSAYALMQADPTTLSVDEAQTLALDNPAWWQDNSRTWDQMPHFAGNMGGGQAPVIQQAYQNQDWGKQGTLFTDPNGRKYRVAQDNSVITKVGENTIGVFVLVQDLENPGTMKYIQVGKHNKG